MTVARVYLSSVTDALFLKIREGFVRHVVAAGYLKGAFEQGPTAFPGS